MSQLRSTHSSRDISTGHVCFVGADNHRAVTWADGVDDTGGVHATYGITGDTQVVVRPDGYIARITTADMPPPQSSQQSRQTKPAD